MNEQFNKSNQSIGRTQKLVASIVIAFFFMSLLAFPAIAVGTGVLTPPIPNEGRVGDFVEINGSGFETGRIWSLYFSNISVSADALLDLDITSYKYLGNAPIAPDGTFANQFGFNVPDTLPDGQYHKNVRGGVHYIYITYYSGPDSAQKVESVQPFIVIGSEIQLTPSTGTTGLAIEISGSHFAKDEIITVRYDNKIVDIISGDTATDENGEFNCTIIVPKGIYGEHTVTVRDMTLNKPAAIFNVIPGIRL